MSEAKLQKRVQRYGWDMAVEHYEPLWSAQLAPARNALIARARLAPGERVLDLACGTGLVTFAAAQAVADGGAVVGVDISGEMIHAAALRAADLRMRHVTFARMDAEALGMADEEYDVVLCSLGLMYMPEPERAVREMRRVLKPGGRLVLAVWGARERCGWAAVFPVVDSRVASEVCPLFFALGSGSALAQLCRDAGLEAVEERRIAVTLEYPNGEAACDAAFLGGPVAMAWSRFDAPTRRCARAEYLAAISPWRRGDGYELPGEFVVVSARAPSQAVGPAREAGE